MWTNISIWIQKNYLKVVNSIAFYPAFIAFIFLIVSMLMIELDFSELGKQIKSKLHWLSLKDATTARSIISSIAAGIISLTVFSFSMVMVVLNQAASQMSNRVLDKLIGNRFQQAVLGFYIGTIVFALFLLSTIRDIDSGLYIPALSTYLLILLTILDIFLFIYFLHYVTQSVKYEVIIQRIYKETKAAMERSCFLRDEPEPAASLDADHYIQAATSGIYEGFNHQALIKICDRNNCILHIMPSPGSFVLKGQTMISVSRHIGDDDVNEIRKAVFVHDSESIEGNFFYGFRQLMEVAIKALSPGINDPATAILSLRALFQLFSYRLCFFPESIIRNKEDKVRIITNELKFEKIFADTILPIWDYGKKDRMLRQELHYLLLQLKTTTSHAIIDKMIWEVKVENDKMKPV